MGVDRGGTTQSLSDITDGTFRSLWDGEVNTFLAFFLAQLTQSQKDKIDGRHW